MAPARERFSSFQERCGGNRIPSLRLRAKRSENETETEGTEKSEWIRKEREIHPLDPVSPSFLGRVVSGDGIQEMGPPGPTADVPRWHESYDGSRLLTELGMHAQIGHNEPNQPTSVHTIDNKPYIFDSRSLRRRSLSKNSGNAIEICCYCGRRRKLRQLPFHPSSDRYSAKRLTNRGVTCDLDDFLKRTARFDTHITRRSVFYDKPREERIPRRIVTGSASTYKYASHLFLVSYTSFIHVFSYYPRL